MHLIKLNVSGDDGFPRLFHTRYIPPISQDGLNTTLYLHNIRILLYIYIDITNSSIVTPEKRFLKILFITCKTLHSSYKLFH